MNVYSEITPEILSLTKLAESTSKIDPALYTKYDVKLKGTLFGVPSACCYVQFISTISHLSRTAHSAK